MSAKEHYDNHLGDFYSWMAGDFGEKQREHLQFLEEQHIKPGSTKLAIDLGAGHGIQSVSLAKLGFKVKAIDFNKQLLAELRQNAAGLAVEIIEDNILSINKYIYPKPELIMCWGDTITHLDNEKQIEQLLADCCEVLTTKGKLILSFRDYTNKLTDDSRFIPVKSDESRILTCFLEYYPGYVKITDLLHEREGAGWKQKVSSYDKVRISASSVKNYLLQNGMEIIFDGVINRLTTIIVAKG